MSEAAVAAPPAPPSNNPANGTPVNPNQGAPAFVQKNAQAREQAISKMDSSRSSFLGNLDRAAKQEEAKTENAKETKAEAKHPSVEKSAESKVNNKPDPTAEEKKPEEKPKKEKAKPKDALERLEQSVEDEGEPEAEKKEPEPEKAVEDQKLSKWKELKGKADRLDEWEPKWSAENKELRDKLEALEKANRINDYETVQKENAELKKELAKYDIKTSDEYRDGVKIPYEKHMSTLQDYAKSYEMDATKLIAASDLRSDAERDAALEAIIEDAGKKPGAATLAKLSFLLADVAQINEFREQMIANAEQASEAIKLQRERLQAVEDEKRLETFRETGDAVLGRLQKPFKMLFENPEIAKDIKDGFTTTDKLPEPIQAYSQWAGKILPHFQEWANTELKTRDQRIKELEGIISKRNGASPSVETLASTEKSEGDPNLTLSQRLELAARRG